MPKKAKGGGAKGKKGKKKGGKSKGPKGKKLPKVGEALHPSEMPAGGLMAHIKKLLLEKDRELEERNLFLLEKNKLWALWQLAVDKVKTLKDDASHMEVKLEQSRKERANEEDRFSQKLRMLQSEETKKFGSVRLNHLNYMKKISDDIWEIENILRESSLSKRKAIRKQLESFYEILRGLRLAHAKSVSDMYEALSRTIGFYVGGQDRSFFDRKADWEESYLPGMEVLRQKKMEKLDLTNLAHEQTLLEMKTFFDDVTTNNLAVMTMLAEEIDIQKLFENRLRRDLRWSKEKYHAVHDPLQKMLAELEVWEGDRRNAAVLRRKLKANEIQLKQKEHCSHMLDVTNECVQQQLAIATAERDKLRMEFSKTARELQRKTQMKSLVLQFKTKAAQKDFELFAALSQNISKPPSDRVDHFHELTKEREAALNEYRVVQEAPQFENYATSPTELACIEKTEAMEFGSVGLTNRERCINRPWRKLQSTSYRTTRSLQPRIKEILHPRNIFNQLPQLVSKAASASSTASMWRGEELDDCGSRSRMATPNGTTQRRKSTALVSIFPPKDLGHITSRQNVAPVVNEQYQTIAKDKLTNLIYRVRFGRGQPVPELPPPCDYPYLQAPKNKAITMMCQQQQQQQQQQRQSQGQGQSSTGGPFQTSSYGMAVRTKLTPSQNKLKAEEYFFKNRDTCKVRKTESGRYIPKSECLRQKVSRTEHFNFSKGATKTKY